MSIVIQFLLKFCTVESFAAILARIISYLLSWASAKGGSAWDTAKKIILQLNTWSSLFLQVYDDDKMTTEEEALVADAIAKKTPIDKVVEIITKTTKENIDQTEQK